MTLNRRRITGLAVLLVALGGCAARARVDPLPAIDLEAPAPVPADIAAVLDSAFAARGPDSPLAVLVVHRGHLLAERYTRGVSPDTAREAARLGQRCLDDARQPDAALAPRLAVLPSHDLVVVRLGQDSRVADADALHRLVAEVIPALPRVRRPETPTRERSR